ncbi:MAG TPA: peptidyl-prolyl cis-trans isomerase [Pirellulales bacterium]|nr:peptidyl-prolyl cis-trans isomerase [Pirellulales bacterium]
MILIARTVALAITMPLLALGALPAEEPPPIVFEATRVLAKVDSESILAGDVVLWALADFNKVKDTIPPNDRESSYRQALTSQIMSLVKIKLLYLDAKKQIAQDKLPELIERIERAFDDEALEGFLNSTGCATRRDLDEKLKPMGSSIERVKRNFVESQIAQQWFRDQAKVEDIEVTRDAVLARYRENQSKYEYPAKARYEELVLKPSDRRDERQARAALAQMIDGVNKGAPWADVAKARSEGTTAAEGGRQAWISQGSHRSGVIDKALFSLPVGAISPILKDDRGFYIIRVIQREPAGRTPFSEVENELTEEIQRERGVRKQVETMKKLFAEARVWTIFDEQNAAHRPAGSSSKRRR